MKYSGAGLAVAAFVAVFSSLGCDGLGAVNQGQVAYVKQQGPTPAEIAAHPCKYNNTAGCMTLCRNGDFTACNSLGVQLELGSTADGTLASGFYTRACDANYAPGCTNLAWLYALGRGVPRDAQQSLTLFNRAYESSKLACRRGDMSGCMMAGEFLRDGRGVEADDAQALAMFEMACAGGEERACNAAKELKE